MVKKISHGGYKCFNVQSLQNQVDRIKDPYHFKIDTHICMHSNRHFYSQYLAYLLKNKSNIFFFRLKTKYNLITYKMHYYMINYI